MSYEAPKVLASLELQTNDGEVDIVRTLRRFDGYISIEQRIVGPATHSRVNEETTIYFTQSEWNLAATTLKEPTK